MKIASDLPLVLSTDDSYFVINDDSIFRYLLKTCSFPSNEDGIFAIYCYLLRTDNLLSNEDSFNNHFGIRWMAF